MISHSPPLSDHLDSPQEKAGGVEQGQARDNGEAPCRSEGNAVAEVEQRGGDGAEEDGELEPGEKGAFGRELDFGFDADGDVDAWDPC